jgi:hypothetical protein
MKTVTVSYKSEILGEGIFWKGPEKDIKQIRNIPARRMAELVVVDGKTRNSGMWQVEIAK